MKIVSRYEKVIAINDTKKSQCNDELWEENIHSGGKVSISM